MIKCKLSNMDGLLLKAEHMEVRGLEGINLSRIVFKVLKMARSFEYASDMEPLEIKVCYKFKERKSKKLYRFSIVPHGDIAFSDTDKEVCIEGDVVWPDPTEVYNQSLVDFLADWKNEPYKSWMKQGFNSLEKDALLKARYIFSGLLQSTPSADTITVDFSQCKDDFDLWNTLSDTCAGEGNYFASSPDSLKRACIELFHKDKRVEKPSFVFIEQSDRKLRRISDIISILGDFGYMVSCQYVTT